MIAFGNVLAEWLVLSFAERSALANEKICSIRSKRLRVLRVKYRIICEKY